ncbi:MAG TPA: hypothetical protein VJB63_01165 [Patescibacteria group bacterium]|nr:hypothetical protein [Patescibacteria group bacterium]
MNVENLMKERKETEIMAVDVVILPPREVSQFAISLSEQLRESSPIVLNPNDYLPHISLSMGYIDSLITAQQVIQQTASRVEPLSITIENISRGTKPFESHYFYGLTIKKDVLLQKLHESLVDNNALVSVEKPETRFFLPESNGEIVQAVYNYVGAFNTHHSKANFNPHITLGAGPEGKLQTDQSPIKFTVDTIYLCQLGNFCTCRKILAEFPLKKEK